MKNNFERKKTTNIFNGPSSRLNMSYFEKFDIVAKIARKKSVILFK